ncbi:T9SS type B sorting domain-containing protein, partial [Flavobacterium pedocola]
NPSNTGATISGNTVTAPQGTYTVTATLNGCSSPASNQANVNQQPATPAKPTLSAVTQPTCTNPNGSFTITNYNSAYTYTVSPAGATINGNTITAPQGNYTVTATLGNCTSVASNPVGVSQQPGTPAQPTLSAVTQPTCTNPNGSFTITNYNSAYTYTVSPAGATINGNTITAPQGNYTVTATLGSCTSVASNQANVNQQPPTPAKPTLSAVTQPTCTNPNGSFTITNYNSAYTYTVSPAGATINGNTITAPQGNYTVTATLGNC